MPAYYAPREDQGYFRNLYAFSDYFATGPGKCAWASAFAFQFRKSPGNLRILPRTSRTTRTFCSIVMIFPYVHDGSRGSWLIFLQIAIFRIYQNQKSKRRCPEF
jgi:hypothetical protein